MSEQIKARSSVVVLETAKNFVLEKRPDLPGKLAYPGKLQLFGGGRNQDSEGTWEDPASAGARELAEELSLDIPPGALHAEWSGEYEGEDKNGQKILRHVSMYRLGLTQFGRESLTLNVQGSIADIPKTPEAIEAMANEFTPFVLTVLRKLVKGE